MGLIACAALLLIFLIPTPPALAQDLWETWNLHGPQQCQEGSRGTWLDPLRSNSDSRAFCSDREKIATKRSRSNDEFDLSDFVNEPQSSSNRRTIKTPLVSRTQDVFSDEPGVTSSAPHDEPVYGQEMIFPDSSQMRPMTPDALFSDAPTACNPGYTCEIFPKKLLYRTYIAGEKEPRMQFLPLYDLRNKQYIWEAVLGGRVGLFQYGTISPQKTEAFQVDLEGAVFARVLPNEPSSELAGSDYRVGLFGTWKFDRTAYKFGYYHISSHAGDEFLIANPGFNRINYVRDSLLAGISHDLNESSRIYGEIGYAAGYQAGARPLELQSGVEYTPVARSSIVGAPFLAVNCHLREDFDFGGGVNIVSGWGWLGAETGHRLRIGLNYYYGPSLQWEFFDRRESLVGGGIWVDF